MTKQTSLICFVATALSSITCCYAQDSDIGAKMDAAKNAFQNGDLAAGPLSSTLKKAEELEKQGCSYRRENNYAEAERLLRQSLAIREKALGAKHILVALILDELAMVFILEKRFDDAKVFTNRASDIWKDAPKFLSNQDVNSKAFVISLNNLGVAFMNEGKTVEAEEIWSEAINLDPTYGLAYGNRAIARDKLGAKNGADEDRAKWRELGY